LVKQHSLEELALTMPLDWGDQLMTVIEQRNPTEYPVLEVIAKRWSPRAFSSRAIEAHKLRSILEAARWAASSFNEQPWRFLVASKDKPESFEKLLSCLRESNQSWAKAAPVLMLGLAKKTYSNSGGANRHAWHDLGQALAALSLQAAAFDIYVHQLGGIYPDKARELFQVPDDYEVATGLVLGYLGDIKQLPEDLQAKEKRVRSRKALSELVFEGEFGQSAELVT
jgi:nitroreductase